MAKKSGVETTPSAKYTARYTPTAKTIAEFQLLHAQNELDLAPSYQRGNVWKDRNRSLLIDSLWRGLPVGSISMFYRDDEGVWEVVDGKQRLTTILEYLKGRLEPRPPKAPGMPIPPPQDPAPTNGAGDDTEEQVNLGDAIAREIRARKYADLSLPLQRAFRNIELPVLAVKADDPREIVEIFYRMNIGLVALTSQEIRNAIFRDSEFLHDSVKIADPNLAKKWQVAGGEGSWFVARGVLSQAQALRMADIQLASELLAETYEGKPLNRRDALDDLLKRYQPGRFDEAQLARLREAAKALKSRLAQLDQIFTKPSLRDHGLSQSIEHHVYAVVGAFNTYGMNTHKVKTYRDALDDGLSEFFKRVDQAIPLVRAGTAPAAANSFANLVLRYATSFTGGQVNSESRRMARIEVLVVLLTLLAGPPPARNGFSRLQRERIWAMFTNKECAVCHKDVLWTEFNAGHALAKADGGLAETWNGRIEHEKCNKSHGANP